MSRGRRYNYDEEKELNLKKVFMVVLVVIIIILSIFGIKQILKADKNTLSGKNIQLNYITLYTNGNWGVINSFGDTIIQPAYAEMILIPNKEKPVFVCTYEVNYVDGTYKTKVINDKNQEIFTGYDNYYVLQNYDENNKLWLEENVLKVQKEGKYGLINLDGTEILPCEYDSITTMKNRKNSLIVKKENNIGIVNTDGTIIVPVEYSDVTTITDDYKNGYIVKNAESKFGVIKANGQIGLECKFEDIKHLVDNNMYIVKENNVWKVLFEDGTSYLEGKVENAVAINAGNIIINNNGKYGVVNIQAEIKIPMDYQDISFMFDDKYIAKKDDKYGIININNETVVDFKYLSMVYNKETDYTKAQNENNTYDYLTRNLSVKLTASSEEVMKGFISIKTQDEIKYYNYKLEEKTNKDVYISNTLFTIKNNGKYGFINKEGKTVVEPIYDAATEQNQYGFVSVKKDGKWGVLDQYGKVVLEPTYVLPEDQTVDFIGKWHICADINANYYTDAQ